MTKTAITLFVASLALAYGTADARRHYHGPHYHHVPGITTVIRSAPERSPVVVNKLTKNDRFEIAVTYLNANSYMSVKEYAKLTGLKKDIAEAELNVFAHDASNPIKPVPGKKNLYYLR